MLHAAALARVNSVTKENKNISRVLAITTLKAAQIKIKINFHGPCKEVPIKIKIKLRAPTL